MGSNIIFIGFTACQNNKLACELREAHLSLGISRSDESSNGVGSDQDRRSVGPDLELTVSKLFPPDDKSRC